MAQVPPLGATAVMVTVQALLGHIDDAGPGTGGTDLARRLVLRLRTGAYAAVSSTVLDRITRDHPGELTNELLCCLTPPHCRELVLKNCAKVSIAGINGVLRK